MLQFKARDVEQNKEGGSSDNLSSDRPGHFLQVPTVATSTLKGYKFLLLLLHTVVVVVLIKLLNHYMVCLLNILNDYEIIHPIMIINEMLEMNNVCKVNK